MAFSFEVVMVQLFTRDLGGYHESLRSLKSDIFLEVYGHVLEENQHFLTAKSHGNHDFGWFSMSLLTAKSSGNQQISGVPLV